MKRLFLFALPLALFATACSPDDTTTGFASFTLEVLLPEETPAGDVISIAGACFSEKQTLSTKYARVRVLEVDPEDFVPGKTLEDGFWFESSLCGRELDADGAEVTHSMKGMGGYTYQVSVARWSTIPEEDISEQLLTGKWSLVGTHNEWRTSLGYPLEVSDDNRIYRNLNCSGSDAFKLVLDDSWLINFGYGNPAEITPVSPGEITLVRDGGKIQPFAGMYTLTFKPGTGTLNLEKTGEYLPPPEPDNWAVIGAFNGWDINTAIPLTRQKNGIYTASYVHLVSATADACDDAGFLLVKNGAMEGCLGLSGGNGTVTPGSDTWLEAEGGTMFVPEDGFYEFSLEPVSGLLILTASPAAQESTWSIVGKFNDWDPTTGIPFYIYGNWNIAFNVGLTLVNGTERGMGFKFVKNKSWDNNRGVSGLVGGEGGYMVVDLDTEISLSQGGGNIQLVEEGAYDIYMNRDTDKAFILKAGSAFLH